jgi:hypothetical protein
MIEGGEKLRVWELTTGEALGGGEALGRGPVEEVQEGAHAASVPGGRHTRVGRGRSRLPHHRHLFCSPSCAPSSRLHAFRPGELGKWWPSLELAVRL